MDHYQEARAAADSAVVARRLLDNEFHGPFRDNGRINDLQSKVGFALKIAQINGTLAHAQEVKKLREALVELLKPREVSIDLSGSGLQDLVP